MEFKYVYFKILIHTLLNNKEIILHNIAEVLEVFPPKLICFSLE